jgi:hypothetical protein
MGLPKPIIERTGTCGRIFSNPTKIDFDEGLKTGEDHF